MKNLEFENALLIKKNKVLAKLLKEHQLKYDQLLYENQKKESEILVLKNKNQELRDNKARLKRIVHSKMKKLAEMYDSLQCVQQREGQLRKELNELKKQNDAVT